jgi:hypothetical protein
VTLDGDLVTSTEALIQDAWITAKRGQIPPPLVDSPKCPGCSLVAICLPDETLRAGAEEDGAGKQLSLFEAVPRKPIKGEVRPLITPRSELRPALETLDLDTLYADLEQLEQRLTAIEGKTIARLRAAAGDDQLFEARRALDLELKPYRARMSAPHLAALEKQFLERKLLEAAGLPRLSLFYLH